MNLDIIDRFNMIFNEYDNDEEDETVKSNNKTQTINNINQIVPLMKNMNPLYEEVKSITKKEELIGTTQEGKFTIMTYENVQYRIYIDFNFDEDNNSIGNERNREIKYRDVISVFKIKREDSETEFEPFQFIENNKRLSNKYRKYIYYDTDDKFIKEETTEDIIDWKTNEDKTDTKIEQLNENKKSITITNYILECTKNDTEGKEINKQISEQYIEEWRKEEETNKVLDDNHVGIIYHKFFNCLYKIQSGNENQISKNEITNENYKEIFKKDNELKVKIIEENGIQYRINYYDVIRIDSRNMDKKNSTEYFVQESKNIINVYERNEKNEIKIIGNKIYSQNYKISYYIDRDGKENIIDRQKVGDEVTEDIKTIEVYETEGLTKEEINSRKINKQYPIDYNRIYYKVETNTKDKKKTRIDKTEHVIINIEHFSEVIKKNNSYILEEYDKEIYIINGEKNNDERPKLNKKEFELQEEVINREMSKNNNKIQIQKYKIYYKKEQNDNKKIYKEELFGGICNEDIQYHYYEKFEVLSREEIEEKRRQKSYPIIYQIKYYKDEINTQDKITEIMYKREDIEIKLDHKTDFIIKNNCPFFVEYDQEIKYINGKQQNNGNTIELNKKEIPLQVKYDKRIINIINDNITSQNYKIYYTLNENNKEEKIYKEEPFGEIIPEKIQYEIFERYEGLTKEQIDEKRKNNLYPIIFRIIYFKKETNTKRDKNENIKTEKNRNYKRR